MTAHCMPQLNGAHVSNKGRSILEANSAAPLCPSRRSLGSSLCSSSILPLAAVSSSVPARPALREATSSSRPSHRNCRRRAPGLSAARPKQGRRLPGVALWSGG